MCLLIKETFTEWREARFTPDENTSGPTPFAYVEGCPRFTKSWRRIERYVVLSINDFEEMRMALERSTQTSTHEITLHKHVHQHLSPATDLPSPSFPALRWQYTKRALCWSSRARSIIYKTSSPPLEQVLSTSNCNSNLRIPAPLRSRNRPPETQNQKTQRSSGLGASNHLSSSQSSSAKSSSRPSERG